MSSDSSSFDNILSILIFPNWEGPGPCNKKCCDSLTLVFVFIVHYKCFLYNLPVASWGPLIYWSIRLLKLSKYWEGVLNIIQMWCYGNSFVCWFFFLPESAPPRQIDNKLHKILFDRFLKDVYLEISRLQILM